MSKEKGGNNSVYWKWNIFWDLGCSIKVGLMTITRESNLLNHWIPSFTVSFQSIIMECAFFFYRARAWWNFNIVFHFLPLKNSLSFWPTELHACLYVFDYTSGAISKGFDIIISPNLRLHCPFHKKCEICDWKNIIWTYVMGQMTPVALALFCIHIFFLTVHWQTSWSLLFGCW